MFPDGERRFRTTSKTSPRAKQFFGRRLNCFRTAKECSGRRLKRSCAVSAWENKFRTAFKMFPDSERIFRTTYKTSPRAETNSGRRLKCFRMHFKVSPDAIPLVFTLISPFREGIWSRGAAVRLEAPIESARRTGVGLCYRRMSPELKMHGA